MFAACATLIKRGYSALDRGAEYCDERVCLSVCLSVCVVFACSQSYLWIFTNKFFVYASHARGSVLQKRRNDTLCTSGFMDDVILAHKPRVLDVAAQLKHSASAALGLAINLKNKLSLQFSKKNLGKF